MSSIKDATIAGYNETIQTIKAAQIKYEDSQEHLFSFMAFCNCEKQMIYDKTPIDMVQILTPDTYRPCCATPLYDAMGFCLTKLRNDLKDKTNYKVLVTIITDGYENSSTEYTGVAIKNLIDELKKEGWTFAYIGANQDVEKVASAMSINNYLEFNANSEDTAALFHLDSSCKEAYYRKVFTGAHDDLLQNDYFAKKEKEEK